MSESLALTQEKSREQQVHWPIEIGARFGLLEVIGPPVAGDKFFRYECRCQCGRVTRPRASNMRRGRAMSCGRCGNPGTTTHGKYGSPAYISWQAMKSRVNRVNNPYFHSYGGRGIQYDPRWETFENFLADMGERPEGKTLDRINVNGNYEKNNCRWATPKEQAQNRRTVRSVEARNRGWIENAIGRACVASLDARELIAQGKKDEALEVLLNFAEIFAPCPVER